MYQKTYSRNEWIFRPADWSQNFYKHAPQLVSATWWRKTWLILKKKRRDKCYDLECYVTYWSFTNCEWNWIAKIHMYIDRGYRQVHKYVNGRWRIWMDEEGKVERCWERDGIKIKGRWEKCLICCLVQWQSVYVSFPVSSSLPLSLENVMVVSPKSHYFVLRERKWVRSQKDERKRLRKRNAKVVFVYWEQSPS